MQGFVLGVDAGIFVKLEEWGQVLFVKRESNCMWTLSLLFLDKTLISTLQGFPGGIVVKHLPDNARVSRDAV